MSMKELLQQLKDGKLTKEQFEAEAKKLLDAGTVDQAAYDAALEEAAGAGQGSNEPLSQEAVAAMIADAVKKAEQSAADRVRTEYAKKLKDEQEEKERLLKEKMSDDEKAKFEKEKYDKDLADREAKINAREVELHTIDQLTAAKLPLSFKPFLVAATKEDAERNVEAFAAAWKAELKAEIDAKFKESGEDRTKRNGGGGSAKSWKDMNLTERGDLYRADPEKAKQLAKEAGERLA